MHIHNQNAIAPDCWEQDESGAVPNVALTPLDAISNGNPADLDADLSSDARHRQAIGRVVREMRDHLDEPFSLREMGEIAFISPYYFNRLFRRLTGIPPFQFLYALRLEAARRLVLTTGKSIVEICYEVGYNSLGTFTRRFAEHLGAPPSRLRSLARSNLGESIYRAASEAAEPAKTNPVIEGQLAVPTDFQGLIFVGLFRERIPQGAPVACTIAKAAGHYRIAPIPDGEYFLFSVALPSSARASEYFHYDRALRGGGQQLAVLKGAVQGSTDLSLRAPEPLDPPILISVPLLLRYAARSLRVTAAGA